MNWQGWHKHTETHKHTLRQKDTCIITKLFSLINALYQLRKLSPSTENSSIGSWWYRFSAWYPTAGHIFRNMNIAVLIRGIVTLDDPINLPKLRDDTLPKTNQWKAYGFLSYRSVSQVNGAEHYFILLFLNEGLQRPFWATNNTITASLVIVYLQLFNIIFLQYIKRP